MINDKNDPTEAVELERLPYDPPRILSVEPLEAVAAACLTAPPIPPGSAGKVLDPNGCAILGS